MSNKIIEDIYTSANYPALEKLYFLVKKDHSDITKKQVKEFLESLESHQILKSQHKKNLGGHIIAFVKNELWQIDIYVMKKYENYNKNYAYMFATVDVFTRRAYIKPMKNKTSEECSKALESVIKKWGKPRVIMSDNDRAFEGKEFQDVLNKHNIILDENVIADHHALGIIDRFARTLKTIISHYFIHNKTKDWISKIDHIIDVYNDTGHKSLNYLSPNEALDEKNIEEIQHINIIKNKKNKTVSDLKIGDKVRVRISGIFTKKTEPQFSETIYTVEKINGTTITLNNNKRYKRTNLLKIPNDTINKNEKINIIKDVTKEHKVKNLLKREDAKEENIIKVKRTTKKPIKLNL
jgi:hypothetical protein